MSDAKQAQPLWRMLIFGLVFGVAFGFLLQKGGMAKYPILIGILLLEDFSVAKVMLSAIVVGMVGVLAMNSLGLVPLHVKPTRYAANAWAAWSSASVSPSRDTAPAQGPRRWAKATWMRLA
jgi:Na+/H+-dicarboxylate symporter